MGGFGSGNWPDLVRRKTAVEQCLCLSVRRLRLGGFLESNRTGEIVWNNGAGEVSGKAEIKMIKRQSGLRLSVRMGDREQFIDLVHTPCNYGGIRYWFLCPVSVDGVYCGGRSAKLYLPPGGKYFGCRKCYDLSYLSMQEKPDYNRVLSCIDNIDFDRLSVTQALRLGGL